MIKNVIESRIRDRIDSFVRELDVLVRKSALEALRGVLSGEPAAVPRGRPGRKPRGATAAASGALAANVLTHVQANDGQSVSQIGAALGVSSKDLRQVMLGLLRDGQLHTTGQRRGTRYHAGPGSGRRAGRRKA